MKYKTYWISNEQLSVVESVKKQRKNKSIKMLFLKRDYQNQFFAMTCGYVLMFIGGLHFAFGVSNKIAGQPWITTRSENEITFAFCSFHMMTIFGAIIARFAYYKTNMTILNATNSLLITIGSIVLVTLSGEYYGLVIGGQLSGLGFGSTYLSFIMYGSEISSPKVRAQLIYLMHFSFTVGIAFFSVFDIDDEAINMLIGLFGIVMSLFSAVLGYFRLQQSHIQLLYNNSDAAALEKFKYFQKDHKQNPNVEVDEMKLYLNEEKRRPWNLLSQHNLLCLFLVLMAKVGYLAIWNNTHVLIRILFLRIDFQEDSEWSALAISTVRLVGSVTGFFVLDRMTRKLQFAGAAIAAATMLFGFGIILQFFTNSNFYTPPYLVLFPMEFFVGFGISHLSDLLKSEIFPLREKRDSILIAIAFEEIIQISFIIFSFKAVIWTSTLRLFPFFFAPFTLLTGIVIILLLKESKHQNLRLTSNLYQSR